MDRHGGCGFWGRLIKQIILRKAEALGMSDFNNGGPFNAEYRGSIAPESAGVAAASFLAAFITLALVLGYPRFYGTEFPMALILVPFFLAGFVRFFFAKGWFSIIFCFLFALWALGGFFAFWGGEGGGQDISFHIVISVKFLLNLFFGYVVYQVIRNRPSVLVAWLIFQSVIIVVSILSDEFYYLLLGFISPRSAEVFQYIYGLRALGFGLFHVDGALTIVLALFFSFLLSRAKFVNGLLLVLLLPLSMAVARTAIVAYAVMGVFRAGFLPKILLFFTLLAILVLSFYVESGPLFEATEIFRNLFQYGDLQSKSVSALSGMYVLPSTVGEWLFGSGQYFSAGESLAFYNGTDVGFLRVIYFSGVGSLCVFILLNVFFLIPLVLFDQGSRFINIRLFALGLIVVFMVVNFKGLQCMSIFAVAFYMYSLEFNRIDSTVI